MEQAWIESRLEQAGLSSVIPCAPQLHRYFALLQAWNEHMDLVADAPEEELFDRHMLDSLSLLRRPEWTQGVRRMTDVGTGAGFPGMVLAIARPDWQVVLIDAQQKRLRFLQAVAEELRLTNVTFCHARAEDAARRPELREGFDLAVARAVAALPLLAEYLLPFVHVGGRAVCWKGPGVADEANAGRKACFLLGASMGEAVPAPIPGRDWQHVLLPMDKLRPTPGIYPRKAGIPAKKPLGQ